MEQQAMPSSRKLCLVAGLIVAATLIAYAPAIRGGFIWDDDLHVWNNPLLRSFDGLKTIWLRPSETLRHYPQYYPLLQTAFWVQYQLFGSQALGYHLVNVLLHGVNAALVLVILRRLNVPGAALAAAVFALHPVHVESAAWISELKNVLSALFYLLAMLAYLRYDELGQVEGPSLAGPAARRRFYVAGLALFACALLSKTVTATLPAAILVVIWWQRGAIRRRDLLPLIPMVLMGLAMGLATVMMEKHVVGAKGQEWTMSPVDRLLVAGRAVWFYLDKLVWPAGLTFIYPRWQIDSGAWWQYLYPATVLAGLAGLFWARRHGGRGPLAAGLFFCGTLFPALGFFDVFPFRYSFVADHFQYLASLGPICLVSGVAAAIMIRTPRPAMFAGLALAAVLGAMTWARAGAFRDSQTLWRDTLQRYPDSWMAHENLAKALLDAGDFRGAAAHFQQAVQLKPGYVEGLNSLGLALTLQGRLEEAAEAYRQCLRFDPSFAMAHSNIGSVLNDLDQPQAAIGHLRQAVELAPDNAGFRNNLALVLLARGRQQEAAEQLRHSLSLDPRQARVHNALAELCLRLGDRRQALAHCLQVVRLEPNWATALNTAAWVLATDHDGAVRDPQAAVEYAQRACELTNYANAALLDTLAAAYAAAGRYAEAVLAAQDALGLAARKGQEKLAEDIRGRLALYAQQRPYVEPAPAAPAAPAEPRPAPDRPIQPEQP